MHTIESLVQELQEQTELAERLRQQAETLEAERDRARAELEEWRFTNKIDELQREVDRHRAAPQQHAQAALSDVVKYTRLARGVQNPIGNHPFGPWEDFYACDDVMKALSSQQPPAATESAADLSIPAGFFDSAVPAAGQQPAAAPTWKCANCGATSADSCIASGCAACEQDDPTATPAIQQEGAALDERVAQTVEWLIGEGHMDWRSDGADESGHEDGFNSNEEEAATLRHYVGKARAALTKGQK